MLIGVFCIFVACDSLIVQNYDLDEIRLRTNNQFYAQTRGCVDEHTSL